jgi:hypothetical protein
MSSITEIKKTIGDDDDVLDHFVEIAALGIKGIDKAIGQRPVGSNMEIIKEEMINMVSYTIMEGKEMLGKILFSKQGPKSVYIGIINENNNSNNSNNSNSQKIVWIRKSDGNKYTIVPYTEVTGGRRRLRRQSTKRNKRRSRKHRKY